MREIGTSKEWPVSNSGWNQAGDDDAFYKLYTIAVDVYDAKRFHRRLS